MATMNGTAGRNGTLAALGMPRKAKAGRSQPKGQPAAVRAGTRIWAYCGVGGTLGLSAVLNGLAFAEQASSPVLAWGLGLAIPGLVLVFSRVAAGAWNDGRKGLAAAGACATVALLALSVQHLALSISRITGEHWCLAALMAVAIDLGLVACELFTLRK